MRAWPAFAVKLAAPLALAALPIGGCANYATLQDPETIPKKELQLGVAAVFNAYSLELAEETSTFNSATGSPDLSSERSDVNVTTPALAVFGRYGLSERFELHGAAWFPFGASIGGKYMLVGDREQGGFAFSPGLDVSAPVTVSANDAEALLMDFYVPLHMGYRASPGFVLYWTPKYVLRVIGGEIGHAAGGTLGAAVGEKTQVLLEGGVLYDTLFEAPIVHGAVGIAFM
jgi:hypothetical protein